MTMATSRKETMRDSITALIQGLRIDQQAMVDAAGRMRYREIAPSYYQLAAGKERLAKELDPFSDGSQRDKNTRFVDGMRHLAADLKETLMDDNLYAVIGATLRIEDAVLDQYKRAVFHASETPASPVLRRQYFETCDSRILLAAMRDGHIPRVIWSKGATLAAADRTHTRSVAGNGNIPPGQMAVGRVARLGRVCTRSVWGLGIGWGANAIEGEP